MEFNRPELQGKNHNHTFNCVMDVVRLDATNISLKYEQDRYTMDPGYSSLSQDKEKFFWSKMIFEQKQIIKMHKSCIIND